MATLLKLLQPVESSWKELGVYLLREELQHKVNAIEADCFRNDASQKALDDVFSKWLDRTVGAKCTWQTLSDAAKKYGDNSLEQYIQKSDELKSKFSYKTGLMKTVFMDVIIITSNQSSVTTIFMWLNTVP